jgi:hypothetical protein
VDTRSKIVNLSAWNPSTVKPVVSGYFDPLLALHVERLEALATELGHLTVVLLDPPDAILPVDARAAVVAGLECVETVLLSNGDPAPEARLQFELEDSVLRAGFLQHVLDRQD